MKKIKIRMYYSWEEDLEIEVEDSVADCLEESRKAEKAQAAKINYNRAYFSLDRGDMIEGKALVLVESPEEIHLKVVRRKALNRALRKLTGKQRRRLVAHVVYGITETKIAQWEGVNVSAVSHSIQKAIKKLIKILEE